MSLQEQKQICMASYLLFLCAGSQFRSLKTYGKSLEVVRDGHPLIRKYSTMSIRGFLQPSISSSASNNVISIKLYPDSWKQNGDSWISKSFTRHRTHKYRTSAIASCNNFNINGLNAIIPRESGPGPKYSSASYPPQRITDLYHTYIPTEQSHLSTASTILWRWVWPLYQSRLSGKDSGEVHYGIPRLPYG